jgi:hypothetical protein
MLSPEEHDRLFREQSKRRAVRLIITVMGLSLAAIALGIYLSGVVS